MRFTRALTIFIVVFLFYVMFTGLATELTILTGLLVASAIALILEFLDLVKLSYSLKDLKRITYFVKYLMLFIITEVVEHIKVAKIILSRRISINPAIVEIPINLKSDIALTITALTITNTPGTIAVDVDKERGVLYVHWLNQEAFSSEEIKRRVLGSLEELVRSIVE